MVTVSGVGGLLFLTNADTEILALRSVLEALPDDFPPVRAANPGALGDSVPGLDGVGVVLVRLLGGRSAWPEGLDELHRRCVERGVPLLAFGGEAAPDAELTARSTAPSSTVAQAFDYLVHGGLANMEHLLRFVADTVLMTGFGFDAPFEVPATGVYRRHEGLPAIGVVFYRAHLIAGNTQFVDDLCDAIEAAGAGVRAVWCYSLRPGGGGNIPALEHLDGCDVIITTVLASGSADGDQWDASALAGLEVPIVQAVASTTSRVVWAASTNG
ncbi:MAG: cobaltochelatase CobN, partial [Acidimicrobiaceae bacterium]|nr:cobaltochelatase CobN [Acidimicrobiaceae bacterium]